MTPKVCHQATCRGALLTLAIGFALHLGAASAHADASDPATQRATARTLFQEGLALLRAERWQDAALHFEKARALHPSPNITYNLTTALVRLGRLVRASELLRDLSNDKAAPAEVRAAGETRLAGIVPRIGGLELQLTGDPSGIVIALDGQPLTNTLLGVPIAVDPRPLELTLKRDGVTIVTRTIDVGEGRRERIAIVLPARETESAAVPAARAKPDGAQVDLAATASQAPAENSGSPWPWIGAGTAVAVAAAVVIFLLVRPEDVEPVAGADGTFRIGAN